MDIARLAIFKSFTVHLSSRVRWIVRVTPFISLYLWSVVLHILYLSIKRSERDVETSFRDVNSIFIPVNVHAFSVLPYTLQVVWRHCSVWNFSSFALTTIFLSIYFMAGSMHGLSSCSDHWGRELAHLLNEFIERARLFWARGRATLYRYSIRTH